MNSHTSAAAPTIRELRVTYTPVRQAGPLLKVGRPADAAPLFQNRLELEPVEVCCVLLLDAKNRVIAIHDLSRVTLDSCIVHPRDVLKAALLANAAGVIVAHNHPSGDPTPSADDIALCAFAGPQS